MIAWREMTDMIAKLVSRPLTVEFLGIMKLAVCKMADVAFYKELNKLSTADFYLRSKRKKSFSYGGHYFMVDRVISDRRLRDEEREYLVLWQGYSRYEASYEPESNITEACISYYENPTPSLKEIFEFADNFREKIEQALKHNRRKETVTLNGQVDVFKYLFGEKGHKFNRWKVLEKDDFPVQFFPDGWSTRQDKHGEGMTVHFPIKMRSFIQWSPKKYFTSNDNEVSECKKAPFEKVSAQIIKVAA